MSDLEQQPPQASQPQPDATQYVPQYQPAPPASPAPPKKKTGLIVAIVIIALFLLCCCGAGVAGYLVYIADNGTSTDTDTPPKEDTSAADAARLAEWKKVQDAFVKHDFVFGAADERQARLADAAIAELYPDFDILELQVEPGSYDAAEDWFYFDHYFVRLGLKSDPDAQTATAFEVATVDAVKAAIPREDLEIDDGDDVIQLEGNTWVVFPTEDKAPLLRGMKDDSYAALMKQAIKDFPGGLPTQIRDESGGPITVHVETWDSYMWSTTYDRIEADYERKGSGWTLRYYKAVIEPKEEESSGSQI